jgi:hypothetical protein
VILQCLITPHSSALASPLEAAQTEQRPCRWGRVAQRRKRPWHHHQTGFRAFKLDQITRNQCFLHDVVDLRCQLHPTARTPSQLPTSTRLAAESPSVPSLSTTAREWSNSLSRTRHSVWRNPLGLLDCCSIQNDGARFPEQRCGAQTCAVL